ncbi:helix-turn-helix domain-containing protein [Streptomyces griseofuscus]|uniref:helix-turn-helix domain-containing protein n=1 Tax=Streptomyces griseofuscus TaxID=146922 RepID=UPI003F6DD6D9
MISRLRILPPGPVGSLSTSRIRRRRLHRAAAARTLFVHPRTVRYRLGRVEELTGRSLSDPRATADTRAALLAVRHPSSGRSGSG